MTLQICRLQILFFQCHHLHMHDSTYVPMSSLTCTYVPMSSLTCTYVPISSYFDICTVRQKYLKHENAQLTFKPNLIKAPKHVIARYKGSKGKLVAVFFQFYCIGVSPSSLCATSYFYFIFLLDMICQYWSVHILILNTIWIWKICFLYSVIYFISYCFSILLGDPEPNSVNFESIPIFFLTFQYFFFFTFFLFLLYIFFFHFYL